MQWYRWLWQLIWKSLLFDVVVVCSFCESFQPCHHHWRRTNRDVTISVVFRSPCWRLQRCYVKMPLLLWASYSFCCMLLKASEGNTQLLSADTIVCLRRTRFPLSQSLSTSFSRNAASVCVMRHRSEFSLASSTYLLWTFPPRRRLSSVIGWIWILDLDFGLFCLFVSIIMSVDSK